MATLTLTPTQDAYITQFYPNLNFGGSDSLFAGLFQGINDGYRSLLKFDVSAIPSESTINSARLRLYIYRNDVPALSKPIKIYRTLSSFNENTVTYNNQPPISVTPDATTNITNELNTFIEWDITNLVNGWVNNSIANNGIMVVGLESTLSLVGFRSKEYVNAMQRPELVVDYAFSKIVVYPPEYVTTTDNFTGSTPLPLGPGSATFGIRNIGTANNAYVIVQLSADGIDWIDNILPFISVPLFGPGDHLIMNTDGHMPFARVAFKSQTPGLSANLVIYAAVTQP